jgi:polyribonucleotide nucleotidyltransferase
LGNDGDLVMIAPLTKHARQRCKERGISAKDAVNRYAVTTSQSVNAVIATVVKNNQRQQPQLMPPQSRKLPDGHDVAVVEVRKEWIGRIIGSKGCTIEKLRREHQVNIFVAQNQHSGKQNVHVWGPTEAVEKTLVEVESILQPLQEEETKREQRTAPNPNKLAVGESIKARNIPISVAGLVLGKGKRNVFRIRDSCSVKFEIQQDPKKLKIVFWGKDARVDSAMEMLGGLIGRAKN